MTEIILTAADEVSAKMVDVEEEEVDLGDETGYVSDSSLNSRKATPPKQKVEQSEDRLYVNRRRTKSERDKRRSSRVSIIEGNDDSGSENSNASLENQPRYRKRANSKRTVEPDKENLNNRRRSRAGSKIIPEHTSNEKLAEEVLEKRKSHASTTTLKMNSKDIYFGTWNPKERAVLDQMLHNIDLKPDHRKSFREKIKRGTKDIKQKFGKISEEGYNEKKTAHVSQQNPKVVDKSNRKSILGIFSGLKKFKDNVLKKHEHDDSNYFVGDDPLREYGYARKKKGFFRRRAKKKDLDIPRRRAYSSNDYVKSVVNVTEPKSNLNKQRSGSTHSLKALFSRAKSVDNLNGAFEYFTNKEQIFQRTPSVTKLNKFSQSTEKLNNNIRRSSSQKSLSHGFEAVKPSAKELLYNDGLVYAREKYVQPATASQISLNYQPPMHHTGYDSTYEDDFYRGYQSDRAPSVASERRAYDSYTSYSDAEYFSLNPRSRQSGYAYYRQPPRRFGPPPYQSCCHHYASSHGCGAPSNIPPGYATPGYATPANGTLGYASPGYITPGCHTPGNSTPVIAPRGFPSGYNSENEYGNAPQGQISMVPFHARRAIQRSLSKNSANSSNYGYQSESSYCEEEEACNSFLPGTNSPRNVKLHRNVSKVSNYSNLSTML